MTARRSPRPALEPLVNKSPLPLRCFFRLDTRHPSRIFGWTWTPPPAVSYPTSSALPPIPSGSLPSAPPETAIGSSAAFRNSPLTTAPSESSSWFRREPPSSVFVFGGTFAFDVSTPRVKAGLNEDAFPHLGESLRRPDSFRAPPPPTSNVVGLPPHDRQAASRITAASFLALFLSMLLHPDLDNFPSQSGRLLSNNGIQHHLQW